MKYSLNRMKQFNYLIFVIVAVSILIVSLPAYAAEGGFCGPDLRWHLSGGILTITGKGEMDDYKDGMLSPWNEMAEDIEVINLPSGLTSIGDYAFAECTNLLQVNLGSVQTIGDGAFYGCESLSSISFPSSVTSIGAKAFYRCYALKTVTIPANVTDLGSAAFGYCEGLVRAIVNSPIDSLPIWTFYGCSNLTDVSLAPQITSVGEYAFEHCDNLHGIYLQSGDDKVAAEIEESISREQNQQKDVSAPEIDNESTDLPMGEVPKQPVQEQADEKTGIVDPFVATHGMPESSTSSNDSEDAFTSVTVVQKGDLAVSITEVIDYTSEDLERTRIVEATVQNSEEWASVVQVVDDEIESVKDGKIIVEVQLTEARISADELKQYAGKNIILHIKLSNGVIWKIDMLKFSEKDFSGTYNLDVTVAKIDETKTTISSETVYQIKFSGNVDFNVTVGVNLGKQNDKATLFVKESGEYELINTMIVDNNSYAWFSLAGASKGTKYYIGMNVDKIKTEDATIPETMYAEYGIKEDGAYLMDEDGMQYRITGRTSRWGITGKQFVMYVGAAIGATVLIVGSVMVTLHIIKKSREKYERMAEEEAIREQEEEDTLRMEIMKELLGESEKKS